MTERTILALLLAAEAVIGSPQSSVDLVKSKTLELAICLYASCLYKRQ